MSKLRSTVGHVIICARADQYMYNIIPSLVVVGLYCIGYGWLCLQQRATSLQAIPNKLIRQTYGETNMDNPSRSPRRTSLRRQTVLNESHASATDKLLIMVSMLNLEVGVSVF